MHWLAADQYLLDYFSNRLSLTMISGFISHTLMLLFFESRRLVTSNAVQENQKIQFLFNSPSGCYPLDAP